MTVSGSVRQTLVATKMLLVESNRQVGFLLGFTVLFPIGILFFLNELVAPDLRTQVLVGVIMMEMALLNINTLAQSIGTDKQSKLFDLWVSLPISPVVYVLGIAFQLLPYSLLSAFVTLGVAIAAFGIQLPWTAVPLLVFGLVVVWASTLGIGFLIGVYGRSPRQINLWAQLIGILLSFFAPVFYPLSALPAPLQVVASAWPLTWGAQFLLGILHSSTRVVLESGLVLGGFIALWFVLIGLGLRWRQK
ncbi:MAG: ABC transporter permease [Thermoplasmata archaeon]